MSLPYNNELISLAKELRRNATLQERRLWREYLRDYPLRFQRQKVIGNYIVDFCCHAARLVIELDGDQHGEPEHRSRDALRTEESDSLGLRVIRFTNQEVTESLDSVCRSINRVVRERLPLPAAGELQLPVTEFDDN